MIYDDSDALILITVVIVMVIKMNVIMIYDLWWQRCFDFDYSWYCDTYGDYEVAVCNDDGDDCHHDYNQMEGSDSDYDCDHEDYDDSICNDYDNNITEVITI